MYGPTAAYQEKKKMNPDLPTSVEELTNIFRTRPNYMGGWVSTRRKGNHSLRVHYENGLYWLVCKTFGVKGSIDEYLICESWEKNIFRLTYRRVHGSISILEVVRRDCRFPVNGLVRMNLRG